jgi:hypothetical protein
VYFFSFIGDLKMPHEVNILEFKKAFNCGSILLETYTRLVVIELRLHDIPPLKSHGILEKLNNLARSKAGTAHAGALNARQLELRRAFKNVITETRKGTGSVRAASYPDLRYCRFSKDWPDNTTSLAALNNLYHAATSTIQTLRTAGYKI